MQQDNFSKSSLNGIDHSLWSKLSRIKIYFGHKSVGNNILAGIKDLMCENNKIKLNIVETENAPDFNIGIFAHSKIGENSKPNSKIDAFLRIIEDGAGDKFDIAFFKLCFVDVKQNTDIEKLFINYKSKMAKLKKKYPKVTFIHVTVPYSVLKTSYKTWVKKLIGKDEIWEFDDIIRKNEYNNLLRREYEQKEPIFDIARIESTYPDGKRMLFKYHKNTYYCLLPEYSNDGGHLNKIGRKKVAEQLLLLLINLIKSNDL